MLDALLENYIYNGFTGTLVRGILFTTQHFIKKISKYEEFEFKTDTSIFINLRYLRLKLLKNKENNNKICHIFHHNFKNIPCYVMSEVSLKRFYCALFDDGLTLKTLKLAFIVFFLIQSLHSFLFKPG